MAGEFFLGNCRGGVHQEAWSLAPFSTWSLCRRHPGIQTETWFFDESILSAFWFPLFSLVSWWLSITSTWFQGANEKKEQSCVQTDRPGGGWSTLQRFEASACHFPVGECARAHDEEEGASQGPVVMFALWSGSWYPGEQQHGWLIDVHHPLLYHRFWHPCLWLLDILQETLVLNFWMVKDQGFFKKTSKKPFHLAGWTYGANSWRQAPITEVMEILRSLEGYQVRLGSYMATSIAKSSGKGKKKIYIWIYKGISRRHFLWKVRKVLTNRDIP